jgi:hypothetical protein
MDRASRASNPSSSSSEPTSGCACDGRRPSPADASTDLEAPGPFVRLTYNVQALP